MGILFLLLMTFCYGLGSGVLSSVTFPGLHYGSNSNDARWRREALPRCRRRYHYADVDRGGGLWFAAALLPDMVPFLLTSSPPRIRGAVQTSFLRPAISLFVAVRTLFSVVTNTLLSFVTGNVVVLFWHVMRAFYRAPHTFVPDVLVNRRVPYDVAYAHSVRW